MIRIALDADLERRFKEACDNRCVKQAQLLRKLVEPVIAGWIRSGSLPDLPLTDEAKNYLIDERPDAFVDDVDEKPDDDAGDDSSWS